MTEVASDEEDEQPKQIPRIDAETASRGMVVGRDDAGIKEAQLIGSGAKVSEIKRKSEERESDRAEKFGDNFETISIFALWFGFVTFLGLFGVWAYHLVTPESWHFLSNTALDKLQLVVTGGFVTGVVSSHMKKRLS
ncbi:hypothetical protein [Methylobacterium sp. ARG-1]|uniref:hypothetical protein n=1 Tax=Methylobacterium sp. ARG-1 TaxID=1692501 RepID=UPI001187421F|nr:hypothetical protein [Methylobacterium sp. ARG-1]